MFGLCSCDRMTLSCSWGYKCTERGNGQEIDIRTLTKEAELREKTRSASRTGALRLGPVVVPVPVAPLM
jgi:hypothetical protein